MPANLPPQYKKVEEEYRKAGSPAERLEKVRELFRLLPKHKGTEKLQAELKQRMSRLSDDLEAARGGGKKRGVSHRVPHEGAGQIVLVGPPNAGKSALLAALTHARPVVAPYPYTTRAPAPGMMAWEDVRVQLVDLPPVSADAFEPWLPAVIRSADAALLVLDGGDDEVLDAAEAVLRILADAHIELVGTLPFDVEDLAVRHLPTVVVANQIDRDGAPDRLELLREAYGDRFPIHAASAVDQHGLDELRRLAYDLLGVIRVYTKVPGKPADRGPPFAVPEGSTVADLARVIHRDLEGGVKFARVWGTGVFEGQTVSRDHELCDGDVVELHF